MDAIETDRLVLRQWRDSDFAPFAALNADPRVMEFYPGPLSTQDSDAFAHRIQESLARDGFGLYATEVKSSGRFIGYVGFAHAEFAAPFTPAIEIGWRLGFGAWGFGYATEAALACLDHGFSHLGFDEVVSFTSRQNARSIAVMKRLAMETNPSDDFEHPKVPERHPLRPHVLYRITKP
ncbi:MAG: GNAT family N-acetyltransferase [Alphaproteobacteria bacterium]|nr:GNAT family N-acetyltransferase [Alphaproteobacteria bacterium]MBT5860059.1 GNAT family N-acetyltransferase [Alphaproteobacteria bacterium]